MEGMRPHSQVEGFLAAEFHQVFVGADSGRLQGLRGELFILIRHQVDTQGKVLYGCLLPSQVIDTNFRICKQETFTLISFTEKNTTKYT